MQLPKDCTHTVDPPTWPGDARAFGPLSAINVLIGPNNSGKSRLLRRIYQEFGNSPVDRFTAREELRDGFRALWEVRKLASEHPDLNVVARLADTSLEKAVPTRLRASALGSELSNAIRNIRQPRGRQSWPPRIRELLEYLARFSARLMQIGPELRYLSVYCPVVRSARPIGGEQDIRQRFKSDYKLVHQDGARPADGRAFIHSGEDLNQVIRSLRLGPRKDRALVGRFERFLRERFFGGMAVELVAKEDTTQTGKGVLHVQIGNELERPIYELGDGLAQLIILSAPVILYRERHLLLFIEEPELNMHPGMQRMFLETIANEPCASGGSRQVFLTTHSTQFVDMTLDYSDISVFSCSAQVPESEHPDQSPTFKVRARANCDLETLKDLGVRNSSLMLTNCTVWVEGIFDRMYFRHYLKMYLHDGPGKGKTGWKEDLHFSFVEYGGANVVHWSFLDPDGPDPKRLCGELLLIADADDSAAKRARHSELNRVLGENFLLLACREVENLISPDVLKRVLAEKFKKTLSQELKYEDYKDKALGSYLDSVSTGGDSPKSFAGDSGTIWNKRKFAEVVIGSIESWDQLTPEAKHVTERIVKHIEKHNR